LSGGISKKEFLAPVHVPGHAGLGFPGFHGLHGHRSGQREDVLGGSAHTVLEIPEKTRKCGLAAFISSHYFSGFGDEGTFGSRIKRRPVVKKKLTCDGLSSNSFHVWYAGGNAWWNAKKQGRRRRHLPC